MYAVTTNIIKRYLKYRYYLMLHDLNIIIQFCQCSLFDWESPISFEEKKSASEHWKLIKTVFLSKEITPKEYPSIIKVLVSRAPGGFWVKLDTLEMHCKCVITI